jgi:GDPmannose 4,6-dehydratase
MNNKKALIIGVSGQDGTYLAKLLLEKGYVVIGTSRDATSSSFANLKSLGILDDVQVESVSLNDFRSVIQVLKKHRPDEVYNLAGQSSVGLSFEQPVETFESISVAVLNLLEAIRFMELPVRLYNASSSECFGNTEGRPATEKTPFHPRSPYAVAKAAAYWQVANYREAYGMYACSGLLFNHESPLRPGRFVTQKIVRGACQIAETGGGTLRLGDLSIKRDWGWAPEYVAGMWAMLQQKTADDYILATGRTHSLQEFVETVFSCLDLDWREHVEYNSSLKRPTEIDISVADPSKAARELGWKASRCMRDVALEMVNAEKVRPGK